MRVGFNPNKDQIIVENDFFHQVVIPVYIPNFEGYFRDSFQIFQYCLGSLFKTSHDKTYFTIVNNGSCKEVEDFLNKLHSQGKIHEVIHTTAIGKLNAVLKGLTGHSLPLVTITDADVFFQQDWQKATYDVFNAFPKAGVVSTTPNPKMVRYFTSNILFENLFTKKLGFTKVKNPNALKAFEASIGASDLFNEVHLDKILTLSDRNVNAAVGAGHFVATYKGTVFSDLKERFSKHSLGGNSESDLLDKPVVEKGYWRLSTEDNYTLHMGNVLEDWMLNELENLRDSSQLVLQPDLKAIKKTGFLNRIKINIFSKIIYRKTIWQSFLHYKGLTKYEAKRF